MSTIEPQPFPLSAKGEFARKADHARDQLLRMAAQERSIDESIRTSRKAIQQSHALIMEPYDSGC